MVDLATHCLADKVEHMGAALMLLVRLVAEVAEANNSVIIDAARSVTASRISPEDAACRSWRSGGWLGGRRRGRWRPRLG
tara:strand:+ start:82 stop:321 length:240 start_codon:yes stop_codon:yes gene_type:complete